jgi:signal transduction histidine kinase
MTSTGRPKVLVVDDHPGNLDAVEAMLETIECTVVRAQSADDALLALLRHDFAAIVLDIRMPGMNGIDLAKLIKQRRRSQLVPILFLTAHMMDESDVLRGYGAGAVDYLSKPINPDILRSKVGVFIDLFRKTRALAELNETLQREMAERLNAQAALERANHELEARVQERTAALREARDEAERQSRLKDEFLATLSHELRTPMNAILGWLSILDSGKPIRDVYSALAVIRRNAEMQAKLIDDLLDMNRLLSGNMRLEMGAVDVASLVQTTIQALKPAADGKGVQLIAAVESGVSAIADGRRLQQVLWNLVHNAIKFTTSGQRVDIRVRRVDNDLHLTVHDNGQGIDPAFLPHVFERFRQEDPSTTRATLGLGLGLSIAKHLVELHGGSINASSGGSGEGSTFLVRIPIAPAAALESKGGASHAASA